MEKHPPHNPGDEEPNSRHLDDLEPGEIDLTGVIWQDDDLRDVIGDAISEMGASGGEVPEWGARAVARALANRREERITGALHHFAATGRLDKETVLSELVDLRTYDAESTAWIILLRAYIERVADETGEPATPAPTPDLNQDEDETAPEAAIGNITLEEFGAYLRFVFAEADVRGDVIPREDAQTVAGVFARLLPPDSQMRRFADTGDAHPALIHQESQTLKARRWQAPQIPMWLDRFEQYLATQTDLGQQAEPPSTFETPADNPDVAQDIRDHAYQIPDTDREFGDGIARALARVLANRRDDPPSGALHQFAATGQADREAMVDELLDIYRDPTTDDQTLTLVQSLGIYVTSPAETSAADESNPQEQPTQDLMPLEEIPAGSTPLEELSAYLRTRFADADARGDAISRADAQVLASLLTPLLDLPGPQMERFAQTGDAHPAILFDECEHLRSRGWPDSGADVRTWVERFEQHLASRIDLGRRGEPPATVEAALGTPQLAQGVRDHGDAFRAFLELPDIESRHRDLLDAFQRFYVGAFASMRELIEGMTEIGACMTAVKNVAAKWGLEEYITFDQASLEERAREVWDIIGFGGTLYVFNK